MAPADTDRGAEVARLWEANAETWTRHARAGYDVYRDALNTPAFLAMLPDVRGKAGLDMGCGEGNNTRAVARQGARMQAVDISPTFIRHASATEAAEPLGIRFAEGDAMALPFPDAEFDFVTAFMCLMDMADPARALGQARRVLRPGGFLQFSILHPCFVPPHRKVLREADGQVRAIEIADYFDTTEGKVDTFWFSTLPEDKRAEVEPFRVARFHRTLSGWVRLVLDAGLVIEAFGEPSATPELAAQFPAVADTQVAPLFLIIRARKPG